MNKQTLYLAAMIFMAASCSDDITDTTPMTSTGLSPERVAEYIQGSPKTSLRIDLDYVAGMEPNAEVQATFLEKVTPLIDKADGIQISLDDTLTSRSGQSWTFEELVELANDNFDAPTSDTEAAIHVMAVDGFYGDNDSGYSTLGLAWSNRNIVLFRETIDTACSPTEELQKRGLVERACNATLAATWIHEFGHAIGLVNAGLPMVVPHNSAEHPTHSNDPDSIMYWAIDTGAVFDLVKGKVLDDVDPIPPFGDACIADIDALRYAP